jgi:uncharacterized protein
MIRTLSLAVLLAWVSPVVAAQPEAPWGKGKAELYDYAPHKVLYDVSARSIEDFSSILDRVSYLNNLYGADPFQASIVLVLHGDEISFFAIENQNKYADLMRRAQSLTVAGPIEFRMCRVAAKAHGYDPDDIHGFVQLVPMADAEIVKLQQEGGYAYMR